MCIISLRNSIIPEINQPEKGPKKINKQRKGDPNYHLATNAHFACFLGERKKGKKKNNKTKVPCPKRLCFTFMFPFKEPPTPLKLRHNIRTYRRAIIPSTLTELRMKSRLTRFFMWVCVFVFFGRTYVCMFNVWAKTADEMVVFCFSANRKSTQITSKPCQSKKKKKYNNKKMSWCKWGTNRKAVDISS